MIWIVIGLVYLTAVGWTGITLTKRMIAKEYQRKFDLWGDADSIGKKERARRLQVDDRGFYAFGGFALACVLPVVAAVVPMMFDLVVRRTTIFHAPDEVLAMKERKQAEEIAEYKRIIREYELKDIEVPRP